MATEQIGGLKLLHPNKMGFQPLFDMISSPSARIGLLSSGSLKGFLFTLDVPSDDAEYNQLVGRNFREPVTSYILKVAILTPERVRRLDPFKTLPKESETKNSYFEEAKLQQTVWKRSIQSGIQHICPPIANFSLFDSGNALGLLKDLSARTSSNPEIQEVLDYILRYCKAGCHLGVIVMPNVQDSVTLKKLKEMNTKKESLGNKVLVNEKVVINAVACVCAKLAALFIVIHVIHFDLHDNNALVYETPDDNLDCQLIDFGRASDLLSEQDDKYLSILLKNKYSKRTAEMFRRKMQASPRDEDDKRERIQEIMEFLNAIDEENNMKQHKRNHAQMTRLYKIFNDPHVGPMVQLKTYDNLHRLIENMDLVVEPERVEQYEKIGHLVNFSRKVDAFFVPFRQMKPSPKLTPVMSPLLQPHSNSKRRLDNDSLQIFSPMRKKKHQEVPTDPSEEVPTLLDNVEEEDIPTLLDRWSFPEAKARYNGGVKTCRRSTKKWKGKRKWMTQRKRTTTQSKRTTTQRKRMTTQSKRTTTQRKWTTKRKNKVNYFSKL